MCKLATLTLLQQNKKINHIDLRTNLVWVDFVVIFLCQKFRLRDVDYKTDYSYDKCIRYQLHHQARLRCCHSMTIQCIANGNTDINQMQSF